MIANTNDVVPETKADEEARKKLEKTYNEQQLNISPEQQVFLDEKLSSKLWRMNHIYSIRTKDNVLEKMKLNSSQMKVLVDFKHARKLILKSRQQGISTLYLAYYLDDCLFKPGFQAGIQSYGQDESDKLSKRAELMWSELDQNIKDLLGLSLVSNNSKGMTFSNGSILKIGNFRGDTLQALHVSEIGKIAKKFPEKAKELKTGAFQAVGKNNKITLESTAEGPSGMFYEMWKKAYKKKKLGAFDFQAIFLGWIEDPDCTLDDDMDISERLEDYFSMLEERLDVTLTKRQKNWYVSKEDELSDGTETVDMKQEYPSYPEEAFERSTEGVIFKKEYQKMVEEKRILPNLLRKMDTTVSYDIGVNDETVLWFHQVENGAPRLVFVYSNSGEGLEHYIDTMKTIEREYGITITRLLMPHDIEHREFTTGRTRIEELRRLFKKTIIVVPKLSLKEGINATRQYLKYLYIDSRCKRGIEALATYRWQYNKQLNVFMHAPQHDWTSNFMDSLRYGAIGIHYNKTKVLPPEKKPDVLEDLWELNDRLHDEFSTNSNNDRVV